MDEPTAAEVLVKVAEHPGFREAIERSAKVQRRLREAERAAEERGLQRGLQRGQHRGCIAGLVEILELRHMPLSSAHIAQLRRMSYPQLPGVKLAMTAKSAEDFARRAGLLKKD